MQMQDKKHKFSGRHRTGEKSEAVISQAHKRTHSGKLGMNKARKMMMRSMSKTRPNLAC